MEVAGSSSTLSKTKDRNTPLLCYDYADARSSIAFDKDYMNNPARQIRDGYMPEINIRRPISYPQRIFAHLTCSSMEGETGARRIATTTPVRT